MKALAKRTAALMPGAALGRVAARATDDAKRESQTVEHTDPEFREVAILLNEFKRQVPGWSQTRPAMRNMITGEKVPVEGGWLGQLSPFQVTVNKNDPVLNELVALDGAGLPKEIPRIIGGARPAAGTLAVPKPGEGVRLSDKERERLTDLLTSGVKDATGRTLYEALSDMVQGPGVEHQMYLDQSEGRDGGKAAMVQLTFHAFLDMAEAQLREEYPELGLAVTRRQTERDLQKLPKSQAETGDLVRGLIQGLGR
jgi:hypothetical protein